MGRRKIPKTDFRDPREKLLASCNLRDLKRACIVRGIHFNLVVESDVLELQSWLFRNYYNLTEPNLLVEFDRWYETELSDQGIIDGPLHTDLKFGYYREDEVGNRRSSKRNTLIVGAVKSDRELAEYKPRIGTAKERAFELFEEGLSTREVIDEMDLIHPEVSEGTVKVWGSKWRKQKKLQEKLQNED